jgi:hypothetical protein
MLRGSTTGTKTGSDLVLGSLVQGEFFSVNDCVRGGKPRSVSRLGDISVGGSQATSLWPRREEVEVEVKLD